MLNNYFIKNNENFELESVETIEYSELDVIQAVENYKIVELAISSIDNMLNVSIPQSEYQIATPVGVTTGYEAFDFVKKIIKGIINVLDKLVTILINAIINLFKFIAKILGLNKETKEKISNAEDYEPFGKEFEEMFEETMRKAEEEFKQKMKEEEFKKKLESLKEEIKERLGDKESYKIRYKKN